MQQSRQDLRRRRDDRGRGPRRVPQDRRAPRAPRPRAGRDRRAGQGPGLRRRGDAGPRRARPPVPGPGAQVWEFYRKNPQALAEIRAPIFEDKVVDHILATATVTEKTGLEGRAARRGRRATRGLPHPAGEAAAQKPRREGRQAKRPPTKRRPASARLRSGEPGGALRRTQADSFTKGRYPLRGRSRGDYVEDAARERSLPASVPHQTGHGHGHARSDRSLQQHARADGGRAVEPRRARLRHLLAAACASASSS